MSKALIALLAIIAVCNAANPVVLIHGLGDSCSNSGMKNIARVFSDELGVHAECIESGDGFNSVFFGTMQWQEDTACANLKANPKFAGKDIDIVGISQGSLIGRGLIQNCDFGGSVKKFISIGGPHMGVYTVPNCEDGFICDVINSVVRFGVYTTLAQNFMGPANYFKDPVLISHIWDLLDTSQTSTMKRPPKMLLANKDSLTLKVRCWLCSRVIP